MRAIRALLVLALLVVSVGAQATELCASAAKSIQLITPLLRVKSITAVPGNILVLTTPTILSGTDLGDDVTTLEQQYFPEEYAVVRTLPPKKVWLAVGEGIDGHKNPSLWLFVFAETKDHCVYGRIGNRVYHLASTAPRAFSQEIYEWEKRHPKDSLVHGRDDSIRWVKDGSRPGREPRH